MTLRSPADSVKDRPDGTWERSKRGKLYRRLRLRRGDGTIYLDRWGLAHDRIGGILLHRMSAPDPGVDLHDHPWWFVTIPLWGGYVEERARARVASTYADIAERAMSSTCRRGVLEVVRPFRPRLMRLDECHTVTALRRRTSWSLVIRGPRVRTWGFFLPTGWVPEPVYDRTVRAERRDLWGEVGSSGERPW